MVVAVVVVVGVDVVVAVVVDGCRVVVVLFARRFDIS